ncbi:hypothetical protein ONZ45_g17687 [Pleurotus djamor]|nr:hypothetical protein ONZ45_g17687 [Pleurotus djamor]
MMNADIEALVLSGELFNPSSRSSSPRRSPSPDSGWHDELLNDGAEKAASAASDPSKESIGMGPGRTGVKGVIKDRDEANEIERNQSQQTAREKADRWERSNLGGKTYLEEQREKVLLNEIYGLEEKVDQLVVDEKSRGRVSSDFDLFGGAKRGRFGHLREVGVKGFVNAVEKEDRGVWVVVHLYDPSLDRCYSLDTTLSQLARAHPETKFIRARASKLGFTSSSSSSSRPNPSNRIRRGLSTIDSDDEDDPYADDDATNSRISDNKIRHDSYDENSDEGEQDESDDDNVDLDMLPTMLVYRDGELVHNWVRVDWEFGGSDNSSTAMAKGIEALLDSHNVLSHHGFRKPVENGEPSGDLTFSNNLGLPSDDDDEDEELLWSD